MALELKALFGTSLRQCRKSRGLTQAELADAADLSLEMVGRLERGLTAPSLDTISALANALRVAPPVLFGAEPSGIKGKRRELLDRISKLLASTSDDELRRLERVLRAMLR